MTEVITIEESSRLIELEAVVAKGIQSFVEVGEALMEIRDSKLYRDEHSTFEAYCKSKWNMSRTFAFNTIESAKVANHLNVLNCEHLPKTESQARPLTKLPAEQQPVAWEKAVEKAGGEQPTAKQVQEAVVEVLEPEPALPEASEKVDRKRGSFADWQKFRATCDQIIEACDLLNQLLVDSQHKIQARDLCASLSKRLMKISNNQ